ncbi:MAG: GNAT family N-acetyltransferase [Chthoniobacter sp.]|uniref:GNAT family N-acetyltransferase n=1 Tax=Chthoniobacter sp. TaxID=2510640 RepID=UPI0032AE28A9
MNIVIRPYQAGDLEVLRRITVDSFDGVSFDQIVESKFGILNGHDWRWRKARHIEEDLSSNPTGAFVAEAESEIVGYITTQLDRPSGKARIPNLAIAAGARGQGLGRRLLQYALDYLRREGMAYAMIETMAGNEVGEHLYPACGFVEIGRQIHFGIQL